MKVLGITAGRKNSNSEILLKEALLACQNEGAEVKMINLKDYNIQDCTGCTICTHGMSVGKKVDCMLTTKDDKDTLMKVFLEQDAIIFSAPTYDLMPSATFLKFMHRNLSYETAFLGSIGAIETKYPVAGLIAVGGSTRSWQSMALEAMAATTFTTSLKIVDMILAKRVPAPAQCLLQDDLTERANLLGKNIIKAINTEPKKRTWLGESDFGWCPNCHSNALIKGEVQWDGTFWPIECQVCGAGGDLEKDSNGNWKFIIAEDGLIRDRMTDEGREHHLDEIKATQGGFYTPENKSIVQLKLKKYLDLKFPGIEV
ncbi:MAG: flavodoxin family protein [Cetobacterium sp.]